MSKEKILPKKKWGPGPWQDEPDEVFWTDDVTGFECAILRHMHCGQLCGYVAVPKGHPAYGKHYDSLEDISAHGGLTFSGEGLGMVKSKKKTSGKWWFGFDCAHWQDLAPGMEALLRKYNPDRVVDGEYRDMAYVGAEVRDLAMQLLQMLTAPLGSVLDDLEI